MSHQVLELNHVAVGYRRRTMPFRPRRMIWALRDVNFQVRAGETLGIIGRNGAGKSTLLKLLAGILDPDKGSIERAPGRASLLSLQVGFLPHLTGRENAILSGMLLGLSKPQIKHDLDNILAFSEIGDFFDEPISTYSSGMRARLGFAVAYFSAPEILLIDEVLGVGDLAFRVKSSAAIQNLINSDRTVILVSHQPSTLRSLCERTVWIEDGVSRMEGPTDEVMAHYEQFVAERQKEQA